MEFGDCTRVYKDHRHSVSTLVENDGLGKILEYCRSINKNKCIFFCFVLSFFFVNIVFTGCGDGITRCFDAKSGALKRAFNGHTAAINCLRVIFV